VTVNEARLVTMAALGSGRGSASGQFRQLSSVKSADRAVNDAAESVAVAGQSCTLSVTRCCDLAFASHVRVVAATVVQALEVAVIPRAFSAFT
jgi:hypothetical protein